MPKAAFGHQGLRKTSSETIRARLSLVVCSVQPSNFISYSHPQKIHQTHCLVFTTTGAKNVFHQRRSVAALHGLHGHSCASSGARCIDGSCPQMSHYCLCWQSVGETTPISLDLVHRGIIHLRSHIGVPLKIFPTLLVVYTQRKRKERDYQLIVTQVGVTQLVCCKTVTTGAAGAPTGTCLDGVFSSGTCPDPNRPNLFCCGSRVSVKNQSQLTVLMLNMCRLLLVQGLGLILSSVPRLPFK